MDNSTQENTMEISKVVEIYIQLRDKKAEIKAEYDAKVAGIDATLAKADGSYQVPSAEHIFKDYQFSTDQKVALPEA